MALVIDASSPAAHTTTTGTNTTAAFTPVADALLLAMWAGDTDAGSSTNPSTFTSSPSQTWVLDAFSGYDSSDLLSGAWAADQIGHALLTGSPGSTTVQIVNANPSSLASALQVFVITGHSVAAPIGADGQGAQVAGSSVAVSYTGTIDGGQGFMILSDWGAHSLASVSPAAGNTVLSTGIIAGSISYLTMRRTDPDGLLGVTTTMTVSSLPGSGSWRWAYAEVVSEEAAQAAHHLPIGSRRVTAKHHAANW
jgi:hypothetical protein